MQCIFSLGWFYLNIPAFRWYHHELSRHAAEALLLSNGSDGSFLLRNSNEGPGCFALSVRSVRRWRGAVGKVLELVFKWNQSGHPLIGLHPLIGWEVSDVCIEGRLKQIQYVYMTLKKVELLA